MEKLINVMCYSHGTQDYARLLHESLTQFADAPDALRFTWARQPQNPDEYCWHNSYRHGLVLNELQAACTERIGMIVDVDVCITFRGWDTVLRALLLAHDACGLEPNYRHRVFGRAPSVFLYAWNQGVCPVDFRPLLDPDGGESVVRKRINGIGVKCDTGWAIGKAGLDFALIPHVPNGTCLPYTSDANRRICLQHPTHMAEWDWAGKLFATHKQAARNHRLDGEFGLAWKERIDAYTTKEYGWVL